MAHRLLSRFPSLRPLVFIDSNRLGSQLLASTAPLFSDFYSLIGQIDQYYRTNASDDDIVLFSDRNKRNTVEDFSEDVELMLLNTGLKTASGSCIWLKCGKNTRDISYFYALSIEERYPEIEDGHRILSRFHALTDLVFINKFYIVENLQRICTLPAGITADQILNQFNSAYRNASDEEITITHDGHSCDLDEADEILIPTGFSDATDAPVIMVCTRNNRENSEPWKQVRYRIITSDVASHRFRREYPTMLGQSNDCFVFMTEMMASGFQEAMRRRVDNVPNPMVENFITRVNQMYAEACDEDIKLYDADYDEVETLNEAKFCRLRTTFQASKKLIYIQAERNDRTKPQPWRNPRPISEGELYPGVDPGEYLTSFANIDLMHVIPKIAETAVQEKWSFKGEGYYDILRSYIVYSAYRLIQNRQVLIDRQKLVAVMNTGLIDRASNDICIVFTRRSPDSKWDYYKLINITEVSRYGDFRAQQPSPPRYWNKTSELVYPIDFDEPLATQKPAINQDHILIDRLHRFPRSFLRHVAYRLDRETQEVFVEAIAANVSDTVSWQKAREIVRNTALYQEIYSELERAITDALRRQRRNYKTIIPSYFPRSNEMCFLMPLRLTNDDAENPALVLSNDGGVFYGRTILNMDMVYKNSRLICKPEADWIVFDKIIDSGEDDEN